MTIHIGPSELESLTLHGHREYPQECCGVLLGRASGTEGYVERVIQADNIAQGDRTRTYQVDWKTLFHTVRRVRNGPEQLIGFYHSHPDTSIEPSERDRAEAWLAHSYLIIAMKDAWWTTITSWRASRLGAPFEREQVVFT